METTDLYLEHDRVYVFERDKIIEADYGRLEIGRAYFVKTKTNRFSIYKKTENFDDEFVKLENDMAKAEEFLRNVG